MRFPAKGFIELEGTLMGDVHNFLQGGTPKKHCLSIREICLVTPSDSGCAWVMLRNGMVLETSPKAFAGIQGEPAAILMAGIKAHQAKNKTPVPGESP